MKFKEKKWRKVKIIVVWGKLFLFGMEKVRKEKILKWNW
jgi:hypothetical protein